MLLGSNPDYRRREPERTSIFDNTVEIAVGKMLEQHPFFVSTPDEQEGIFFGKTRDKSEIKMIF